VREKKRSAGESLRVVDGLILLVKYAKSGVIMQNYE